MLAEHEKAVAFERFWSSWTPTLAQRARTTAANLGMGLSGMDVKTADAGAAGTYLHVEPGHLVMACGVFGNITFEDGRRTIATLPALLVAGGIVIWTRGRTDGSRDPRLDVRARFADHGCTELSFSSPGDARFRVGMHQLTAYPAGGDPLQPGSRIFTFI
jgi:hypothetical protein